MGEKVNDMSIAPSTYEELKRYSLDPYTAVRQAYVGYRNSRIEKHKD